MAQKLVLELLGNTNARGESECLNYTSFPKWNSGVKKPNMFTKIFFYIICNLSVSVELN